MTHLQLILAEAALETIPRKIQNHPIIVKDARRRGKKPHEILLDVSRHYHAMKKLEYNWKRGRPDITHITLLQILGSPANLEGYLQTYVHTINDKVIYVDSSTRLPRNYLRFVGLFEQLFKEGKVPPRAVEPLLKVQDKTLEQLLEEIEPTRVILLTSRGSQSTPKKVAEEIAKEDKPVVIIGGFPHGTFTDKTLKLADEKVAIYPKSLDAWVVATAIIHAYEQEVGIYRSAWRRV
ncbi:MAG: 16S rRNA methyltransferase [Candidatus Methanomethylicota archaeon]|uniref:Ribosomal RNA small subunit methyltransferase Nep1 n=1 Tax=Thermoproteota archaeon TaxID=2056631 RepID=A0A497FA86_9CREN|nr:MAG: 16S rRNA methyltransferase [Candidatus Verstraetearchaeota archaeon]